MNLLEWKWMKSLSCLLLSRNVEQEDEHTNISLLKATDFENALSVKLFKDLAVRGQGGGKTFAFLWRRARLQWLAPRPCTAARPPGLGETTLFEYYCQTNWGVGFKSNLRPAHKIVGDLAGVWSAFRTERRAFYWWNSSFVACVGRISFVGHGRPMHRYYDDKWSQARKPRRFKSFTKVGANYP